jgi:predicted dehydrogenase/acetyltransferase-like isoleucine patch superfamily enzyme
MKKNIAVVGCGLWGKNLVRNFSELGVLFSICDPINEIADQCASQYNVKKCSFTEIINHPNIKGVVLTVPAHLHASMAIEAMNKNKHVFVEKPLAMNEIEAEAMIATAKKNKVHLMVGHLLQYHPIFKTIRKYVGEGKVGEINYIYSNRLSFGKVRAHEDVIWSFAPHDISMILSLTGQEPEYVSTYATSILQKNIPDIAIIYLEFKSGLKSHISVSWLNPYKENKLIVVGQSAMLVFDDIKPWHEKLALYSYEAVSSKKFINLQNSNVQYLKVTEQEPLKNECQHFIDVVEKDIQPLTDGDEGLRVIKVLSAASCSQIKNERVKLMNKKNYKDVFIHDTSFVDDNVTIGHGTKIWHFNHILQDCKIGNDCSLGQNVVVGPRVTIGNKVKIQNNVSVYEGVILEDGVFCGPSCVFTNVHNPRAEIDRKNEYKKTLIKRGATLGANCTIICGITIGAFAFIAAGSVISKDVPSYALMVGVPAKQTGWMSEYGEKLDLPLTGNAKTICQHTKQQYQLKGNEVYKID